MHKETYALHFKGNQVEINNDKSSDQDRNSKTDQGLSGYMFVVKLQLYNITSSILSILFASHSLFTAEILGEAMTGLRVGEPLPMSGLYPPHSMDCWFGSSGCNTPTTQHKGAQITSFPFFFSFFKHKLQSNQESSSFQFLGLFFSTLNIQTLSQFGSLFLIQQSEYSDPP